MRDQLGIPIRDNHPPHTDSYWQAGFDAARSGKEFVNPFTWQVVDPTEREAEVYFIMSRGWENGYRWYWQTIKENA